MNGMKRSTVALFLITAYCVFAVAVMYHSLFPGVIAQDQTNTPRVAGASTIKFAILAGAPDPNHVLDLANQVRIANGSKPLVANEKLGAVAAVRAADMAKRQYYAHRNPDGKYYYDLLDGAGIKTDYSCENLDLTFTPDVHLFIDQWMASAQGHRECLLNPDVTQAGYAVTKMDLIEHDGHTTPTYVVVAIQSTSLR